ncbi:mechanosensitive ion channel family protein [Acinetobacter rathckeae]|uniref:mechanosensitive ion channel family protein n=1 Tax=Acinetobacter rathckeae TaxID=2605272 RepID=UPI0018A2D170|nr:mechanosensitive ion channel family protein [Acinetobacter rathckeae]MBF7688204.1 mechanosensitive ion channel family protein [Acinetobacter rathckeae]MBF7695277.1 mechanosensitive ion channel family protein [Acinetobacter rathckeae]
MANLANNVSTQTHAIFNENSKYHDAYQTIDKIVASFWERVPYLCIAIIVFIIFWFLSKFFKLFVVRALSNRSYAKQNLVLVLNRVGSTFIIFFGFLIALVIAIPGFSPGQLMSALGIGSVAIGFAFKDIFQNLLSGILILLGEPFRIGDAIICNGLEGTVEDIQIRATTLRSYDGRRIVIPNATVYTSSITVVTAYTQRRCEINVGIGYDDDVQKAKAVVLDILKNHKDILNQPASLVNVTALGDFAINLNIRWWIDTSNVTLLNAASMVHEEIVTAFAKEGISIPYPIQEQITQAPPVQIESEPKT